MNREAIFMAFRNDLCNQFEEFAKRLTGADTVRHSDDVDEERSDEYSTKIHHFARIVNEARIGQF